MKYNLNPHYDAAAEFCGNDTTAMELGKSVVQHLLRSIESNPHFAITTGIIPERGLYNEDDLKAFSSLITESINTHCHNESQKEQAENYLYNFLESLNDDPMGYDVTVNGRSLIANIGEVGEAGLQYIHSYVQVLEE